MKKSRLYGFKKIPTSDAEIADTSNFHIDRNNDFFCFENKKLLVKIIIILFVIMATIWLLSQLYLILYDYDLIKVSSKLTIIINIFDKKYNLTQLLRNLMDQSISFYEIIISKNFDSNYSILAFNKFKKKSLKIKFLQYGKNDSHLKIRIDSAKNATGEYILYINPDEKFEDNILTKLTKRAIKEKTDIIQYDSYHDRIEYDTIFTGPKIFDIMFFDFDVIRQQQYHLTGFFIKKNVFLEAVKGIDNYYFENNNVLYTESMILFRLFKKANSFIKIKRKSRRKKCFTCPQYLSFKGNYNKEQIKEILIYLKFLIENTGNNVQEKRMSAKYFIDMLVKKTNKHNFYDDDLIKLLDEVTELYVNCVKISDYDINLIKKYHNKISKTKNRK